jgi:hypothetical protein
LGCAFQTPQSFLLFLWYFCSLLTYTFAGSGEIVTTLCPLLCPKFMHSSLSTRHEMSAILNPRFAPTTFGVDVREVRNRTRDGFWAMRRSSASQTVR